MPVKTKNCDSGYLYVYDEETGEYKLVGEVIEIGEYDGEE